MIFLCLCTLLSVQAQDISNGSKWWDGTDLYTATVRAGGVVYFQGSDYNELTIEKDGDKAGAYKIIPSRQAEDRPPLRGEFGWRVQHIRQEGMNFLVVRRSNGDASDILVLTPDNLKDCKGQEEWAEKQPVSDIITGAGVFRQTVVVQTCGKQQHHQAEHHRADQCAAHQERGDCT